MRFEAMLERASSIWASAVEIWLSGGWAMIAIALVALVMFALGVHIQIRLRARGFLSVPERRWRRWIDHPDERRGPIGRLIGFAVARRDIDDVASAFDQIRSSELAPFRRDLKIMKVCVGAAPLLGLLGTVTGMLATFGALASGSGGDETMGMVASGISEALITTETGLVIALPGLFMQYHLARLFERYRAFLAHLQTVCAQSVYHRNRATGPATDRRRAA